MPHFELSILNALKAIHVIRNLETLLLSIETILSLKFSLPTLGFSATQFGHSVLSLIQKRKSNTAQTTASKVLQEIPVIPNSVFCRLGDI